METMDIGWFSIALIEEIYSKGTRNTINNRNILKLSFPNYLNTIIAYNYLNYNYTFTEIN